MRTTTLTGKDAAATALAALAVLVFAATREGWNVWLVGSSHRWAAGAIMLLGMLTCGLGSPDRVKGRTTKLLAALGVVALVLAALSIATGSLTALSLLVADMVVLWALSTARHALADRHKPITA